MISPHTKRFINRILPFALIWLCAGIIYSFIEKGLLGDLAYYPSTGNPYEFAGNFLVTTIATVVLGLIVGATEILWLNNIFIQKSLSKKIIYKTMAYVAIITIFLLINSTLSNAIREDTHPFDIQVWKNVWAFFTNFAFGSVVLFVASVIGVSLFYIEVSDNLGQGVLNNFLTGKYHAPVEEERIFMFLDMKSSTTIAEKLGHVRYFELLKEYYADITDPIIQYYGEIYQYVGDEIIVSWKLNKGLADNNCLRCFFAMKQSIDKQSSKYNTEFGYRPLFKAGFHLGKVTTGEIGVIKKEIIFTGDVLNTTARIQGLCNTHNVDILISGQLLNALKLESDFHITALGDSALRGRDEKVALFTVAPL